MKKLLDAIYAAPDDDAPRLVYADWLTERGDPRGELIQVQVERARLGPKDWAKARALWRREYKLLGQHQGTWMKSLSGLAEQDPYEPTFGTGPAFWRGFPRRVKLPAAVLLEKLDDVLAAEPLVTGVELAEDVDDAIAARLAKGRPFAKLRELVLRSPDATEKSVQKLLGSPAMATIETLGLRSFDGGQGLATALAKNSHAARLQELRIENVSVGSVGLGVILQAKTLPALRTLAMDSANVQDAGAERIAGPHTVKLERLELSGVDFTPKSFRAVVTSKLMGNLTHFIFESDLTRTKGPALGQSKMLGNLRVMDLGMQLDDGAVAALAVARLPKIEHLRVHSSVPNPERLRERFGAAVEIW